MAQTQARPDQPMALAIVDDVFLAQLPKQFYPSRTHGLFNSGKLFEFSTYKWMYLSGVDQLELRPGTSLDVGGTEHQKRWVVVERGQPLASEAQDGVRERLSWLRTATRRPPRTRSVA